MDSQHNYSMHILLMNKKRWDGLSPEQQPLEDGVLALWFEWRPALKCLDLWVLTSGGPAVFGPVPRPPSWPGEAPWRAVFSRHELHVSRASWRTENL